MKTKFLLGVIPALLALTSCAGIAPKAENKLFQEDALAHEEIFGEAKFEMEGYRAPRKTPSLATEPMYGVQYQVTESYVHMRIIAAVSLPDLSVSVEWTRTMYKGHENGEQTGHVFKASAEFESTKAYTSLANGSEEPLTIAAFNTEYGTSYDHFVVYTMLNIPKTTYDDYSIKAFVSIDDVASTKGFAATVGQTAFASFDLSRTGHFISGRFDGVHQEFASNHELSGNNAAYDVTLHVGDTFACVYYDSSLNVFLLNGLARDIDNKYFCDGSKKTMTSKVDGDFTVFLNSEDRISLFANFDLIRPIYVDVSEVDWWGEANSRKTVLYGFNGTEAANFFVMQRVGTSNLYKTTSDFDPKEFKNFLVLDFNGTEPSWDNSKIVNQSHDSADIANNSKDCLKIKNNKYDNKWEVQWVTR